MSLARKTKPIKNSFMIFLLLVTENDKSNIHVPGVDFSYEFMRYQNSKALNLNPPNFLFSFPEEYLHTEMPLSNQS